MTAIDAGLLPPDLPGRHGRNLARLARSVLAGPGVLPAGTRQAIAAGDLAAAGLAPALAAWAERVSSRAHEIRDEEVEALRLEGFSEDQIFEAAVAAALGAGLRRLRAGLAALRGA